MNKLKAKLVKEFDKTSYVDFKKLEEEPIDIEYLKERKEKIGKQFKTIQIIATVAMMIMVACMFYLLGTDSFNPKILESLLGIFVVIILTIFGQLTWNKKYTQAQKNIFIIELLEEIVKGRGTEAK
ncbi:MAG: hypothetical protein ABFS35_02300 [Bacteroidota bacterium]